MIHHNTAKGALGLISILKRYILLDTLDIGSNNQRLLSGVMIYHNNAKDVLDRCS